MEFCLGYSVIIEPLDELKTRLLRSAPRKGEQRQKFGPKTSLELNDSHRLAWDQLKKALANAPILAIPDLSNPFVLYSDGSKEFGYGIALRQLDEDGKERPVLFLSKRLATAERNYWATELEVGALVWGISKLRHYLDGNKMTAYTDHTAVKNPFEGTTLTRRNDRLTSWALFLSQFKDSMTIIHKPGHVHRNADAFSRLQEVYSKDKDEAKVRTEPEPVHLVNVLSMDPALKNPLLKDLPNDKHLGKIYRRLLEMLESDTAPGEPRIGKFKLDSSSKLLYFCSKDGDRLCIPKSIRLRRSIYMARMRSAYVLVCPVCNQSKPGRHQPYGQLQPITVPTEPLSVLTMDFVVGLREGNDAILTITRKFSKVVRIITGKTTFTAMDWADDPWERQVSAPPTELEQLRMPYEVERILEKRLRPIGKGSKRRIWQYLVKWKGQEGESWEPTSIITAQAPELVGRKKYLLASCHNRQSNGGIRVPTIIGFYQKYVRMKAFTSLWKSQSFCPSLSQPLPELQYFSSFPFA
jgi:reverse transcriptase-like protein/chromodomain-containing protein